LAKKGFDDTEANTWAGKLAIAVDRFDDAVALRGWGCAAETRAVEGVESDDEESQEEITGSAVGDAEPRWRSARSSEASTSTPIHSRRRRKWRFVTGLRR